MKEVWRKLLDDFVHNNQADSPDSNAYLRWLAGMVKGTYTSPDAGSANGVAAAVTASALPFLTGGGEAKAVTNVSRVDSVIAETLAGKGNIKSALKLTADELMQAGEKFLGSGYKEIGKPGSGVFRSADGQRQFRIDANSLSGNHAPDVPHGHLETYAPGAAKPTTNNHIPFAE